LYAVLFALFVVTMGALEVASSRATARIADYPDPPSVSASPTLPGRWPAAAGDWPERRPLQTRSGPLHRKGSPAPTCSRRRLYSPHSL